MSPFSLKLASKKREAKNKTSHKVAGLFLFVSVFTVSNAHADSKQDIAELEAFYEQVFGAEKKSEVLAKKVKKPKPVIQKKARKQPKAQRTKKITSAAKLQHLINDAKRATFRPLLDASASNKKLNNKDPELVAFYEHVFGKQSVDEKKKSPSLVRAASPSTKKVKSPKTVAKQERKIKVSNTAVSKDNKTVEASSANKLQGLIDQEKKTSMPTIENVNNDKTERTSAPSSEKNPDLAALYTQAFGKKISKNKPASNTNKTPSLDDLFARAFGKKAAASNPSQVTVDLKINAIILGDVTVFSNSQGVLNEVGTKDFLVLLKEVLKDHVFKRVKKQTAQKKKVAFKELEKLGVSATYNSVDLSLDLEINSELRKPQILSMLSKNKASVREENKIVAKDVSAYLNMYSNVGLFKGSSKPQLSMRLQGSVNIGNAVLESSADLNNGKLFSDKTKITYDKPENLQRYSLGNISTGRKGFQSSFNLEGFRISKEFFMDPELQIRPNANESFVLDTDSEVEVFINNQRRQTFYLRSGIYALEDIGLYNGANNIRVRIKDKFGKITVKTSQQFYDSHLLKKDLDLYAFTVGYQKRKINAEGQLEKKPIISGYYQKGLTKNLTMGLDAQFSADSYLLGTEMITPLALGTIKTSLAISGGKYKDSGVATRFQFNPNRQPEKISLDTLRQDMLGLQHSAKGFLNNWIVSGELHSRDFSAITDSDYVAAPQNKSTKQLKARLQTSFGFDISENWRGSLNLGVSDYYDDEKVNAANLTLSRRFNNGMSLSLGAHYDSEDDYSMNMQISIPLFEKRNTRRKTFDVRANSKDNSIESKLTANPTSFVGKNSLGGSVGHIRTDKSEQQSLDLSYRNTKFETKLQAKKLFINDHTTQQINIGFNNSLACVGGKCATSYPIEDSFALVSGPSNQEAPIAINSDRNGRFVYSDDNETNLPDNYSALITDKNSRAVVRLESYKYQNINIDESTLPSGYDTEKTEFEVFPRYHQGFLIKAGGEPATILDGNLVDSNQKPLGFKGGQWVPINGKGKTIAFFSNKAGRFRIASVPAGKYKLELFDYPDMKTINVGVPDLKGKVHNLGNLIITE